MILHMLLAIAGLMGAAGVMLAAAAAHAKPGMGLAAASQLLLVHAPVIVAACAALARGLLARPLALAALAAMICGAALFSGDVLARASLGQRLYAIAAPTGGSLLIGAWLLLAVAALAAARRS